VHGETLIDSPASSFSARRTVPIVCPTRAGDFKKVRCFSHMTKGRTFLTALYANRTVPWQGTKIRLKDEYQN